MNVFLWIIQGALALLHFAGGAYKTFRSEDLVAIVPSVPLAGWKVFGLIEVAGAVLLILPVLLGRGQTFTPTIAGILAVEALVLAVLYGRQSMALSGENPLVWAVAMAVMAGFLAYGRYAQMAAQA